MANYSFDIVSRVDLQEVDNAVNQATKELRNRFDFRGTKSRIEFNRDEKKIQLIGDDELKLRNLQDMLKLRLAARSVPLKGVQFEKPEPAFEGTLRQDVQLVQGFTQEKAKELVKRIKQSQKKVQVAIQGDMIRVSSKSRDDLQSVIQELKENPPDVPLDFTNYR